MAIPLNPEITNAVKGILLDGFKELLGNARNGAAKAANTGAFIAGPQPNNPILAWQHRAGRAVCDRWARVEREEVLPGDDLVLRTACSEYLGANGPGQPTTAPPFTGGQCDCAIYRVQFTLRNEGGGGEALFDFFAKGPLSGFQVVQESGPPGASVPTDLRVNCRGVGAAGPCEPQGVRTFSQANYQPGVYIDNIVLSGDPGGQSCGNPPDEFDAGDPVTTPDPNPGPIGGPPGYPFPNIDISIGPGGDIIVDFGDGEPPEVIDPTNPEGDGDGGGGGGDGGDPGDPTDPGTPGPSQGTGNGGEAEGSAPEGTELVGLKVTVTQSPGDANRFANNPRQPFRGIGYVRMGFLDRLGLDISGGTVISPQFFHAQQRGLTHWAVAANTGFNLTIQPYFREITS